MTSDSDFKMLLDKAARYCAYQERSHLEVRKKLKEWKITPKDAEQIMAQLITENYLNEERFAIALAGGKFRIKLWGRLKIKQVLRRHEVSPYIMEKALKGLKPADYDKALGRILQGKLNSLGQVPGAMQKAARYAISKGYEPDLVWQKINELQQ